MLCIISLWRFTRKRTVKVFRIKWWNLTGEDVTKLCENIKIEGTWRLERDIDKIWVEMADYIQMSAMEVLGVSRGGSGRMKGAWWIEVVK